MVFHVSWSGIGNTTECLMLKYIPSENEQTIASELIGRFRARAATIGIIGLGYVGQPLALRYAQTGFRVLGLDIDEQRVALLNGGRSEIAHVDDAELAAANRAGMVCTTDFGRAAEADALIICVPTPLNKYREPDLGFVVRTLESLVPCLRAGQVISLESTTYPGTTEEEIVARVEKGGF